VFILVFSVYLLPPFLYFFRVNEGRTTSHDPLFSAPSSGVFPAPPPNAFSPFPCGFILDPLWFSLPIFLNAPLVPEIRPHRTFTYLALLPLLHDSLIGTRVCANFFQPRTYGVCHPPLPLEVRLPSMTTTNCSSLLACVGRPSSPHFCYRPSLVRP